MQTASSWDLPDDLYAAGGLRGTYSPLQFVVRLDADLRAALDASGSGIYTGGEIGGAAIIAFSTFFHETIHWWQHIGSTTGLMLSFAYPAQFHVNVPHLRSALADFGPKKSWKTFLKDHYNSIPDQPRKNLNIIVNNWHDIEFNRRLLLDPLKAEPVVNSPFFECIGHSLELGLGHTIMLLASSFDRDFKFLPNPNTWEAGFADLRKRKIDDYYYGSPIKLIPLGAVRIFEGQARFSQMQYLHLGSKPKLTWADFAKMGMLGALYTDAFNMFLEWCEMERPDTVVHSIVQLFLLICDLAINPSDGYPFELTHFESFIISDDPSTRFFFFCRYIARNPSLKKSISKCSREEYLALTGILCKAMACKTPVEIALRINQWAIDEPSIKSLLNEDASFDFINENLPVRVCFSRHLHFMRDKAERPEFFCWPAMHFVDNKITNPNLHSSMKLWSNNEALFTATLNEEIRPTILTGRDPKNTQRTFNEFYRWNMLYEFVRQWTVADGAFNYDFSWLTPKYTADMTKPFMDDSFKEMFGVSPEVFTSPNYP